MRKKTKEKKSFKVISVATRIFICIIALWITILASIEKQNDLTELRLAIPNLAKSLTHLEEENVRLKYEIEQFKSPSNLMKLSRKPEFGHLETSFLVNEIFLPKAEDDFFNESKIILK